jgi:hypothetical protein
MIRIIKYHDAQRIIDIACLDWKNILFDKWGKNIVLKSDIAISEEEYRRMRNACTYEQHVLFDAIFGKDTNTFKVGDWVIGWFHINSDYMHEAWEIGKIKDDYVYPKKNLEHNASYDHLRLATVEEIKAANIFSDGTPCLVSDYHNGGWLLRYANGKGKFYDDCKKSGENTCSWKYSIKLDMNNLPVNE